MASDSSIGRSTPTLPMKGGAYDENGTTRLVCDALADATQGSDAAEASAPDDDEVDILRRLHERRHWPDSALLEVGLDAPDELEIGVSGPSRGRDCADERAESLGQLP